MTREAGMYLTSRGLPVGEHVGEGRDDVDREAYEERPHGRVDRPKKGEYDR